ncbi:MAG: protein kinase [Kofleriaceae bacterium]
MSATADPSRYHVVRRLAVGGMGEIFLARQDIAGVTRVVVLKRLLPELAEDPQQLAMFIDEARIAANLAHSNIVQVHEFGQDAAGYFIVMEYVPGHNLGRVLARAARDGRQVGPRLGAFIMAEVARALDHSHRAVDSEGRPLEIVHRDISPSNVLVSFRGDVKLMDFGIARAANRGHRTNDGSLRGKLAYMAPEQIENRPVDARSDVFSAGIVLWEATTGKRLFDGASDFAILRAVLEQPIPRPSSIDPYYPPALESVVLAALERDPDRRLASADDLAAGLKAFLRTQPTDRDEVGSLMASLFPDEAAESIRLEEEQTKPSPRDAIATAILGPPVEAQPPVTRPARRGIAIILVLAVALAGGALWFGLGSHGAPPPRDAAPSPARDARPIAIAEVVPDAAEPVDAVLPVDARHGVQGHRPRDADVVPPPPDAAAVIPSAVTSAEVTIRIGQEPGAPRADVHLVAGGGLHCETSSLPLTCHAAPGSYPATLQVTGGDAFSVTIVVAAGSTRCFADLARRQLACRP